MKMVNRLLLLITALLAAWQVAIGINDADTLPMIAYTVGFGVLLIACLLLIILGLDVLDSPIVVIVSTIIPLSLSLGLIWEHITSMRLVYLGFVLLGFLAIILTRTLPVSKRVAVMVLALVHGIAGLTIFLLPIAFVLNHKSPLGFALVSVGGALIGLGGLLLSFLKVGKPILSRQIILALLPAILLLMTLAFVLGFGAV
ncbi:MAG: hypothetical protein ACPL4H_10220 [Anaerolineales bacterium]